MAFSKWSLRAVCNRSLLPRKQISKTALLRSALDSGFRRNDGSTTEKRWLRLGPRMVRPLVIAGVYLLLFAACSVTVHPGYANGYAPRRDRSPPGCHCYRRSSGQRTCANASRRMRLVRRVRRPNRWDAIVLALEQRPLRLPVLAPSDACPETPDRWVEGFRYELVAMGPSTD